jgi:2-dehydro-3-deoxyphosphogluconate aldolase/(4S)-4-hydroxy-2-oxoglutarate aldolase
LGPGFIKAIRPLFKEVHFLVTGGVDATEESILGWLSAGASGVGLGSKLITKNVLANKQYEELTKTAQQLLSIQGLK